MSKSRTEIVQRVLRNLGSLPQGQTPSVEESDSIDDLIDPVIADLSARRVITINSISSANPLDDEFFLPLAHCIAWAAAPEFGQSNDAALAALKARAENDFKEYDDFNFSNKARMARMTMRSDYPVRRHVSINCSTTCST